MDVIVGHFDLFVSGYWVSLEICAWATIGSLLLGTAVAMLRISPLPPARVAASAYVTALMNTPLTVVLFFIAFGFPEIGINSSYFVFGVSALVLYTSAFVCESIRSGVNSVSPGQAEAARALGLSTLQTLRQLVIPQAFRGTIPPLSNTLLAMFTNSALVGAFGVGGDLFSISNNLTGAQGFDNLPVISGVAVGYLAITLPAAYLLHRLERKVAIVR